MAQVSHFFYQQIYKSEQKLMRKSRNRKFLSIGSFFQAQFYVKTLSFVIGSQCFQKQSDIQRLITFLTFQPSKHQPGQANQSQTFIIDIITNNDYAFKYDFKTSSCPCLYAIAQKSQIYQQIITRVNHTIFASSEIYQNQGLICAQLLFLSQRNKIKSAQKIKQTSGRNDLEQRKDQAKKFFVWLHSPQEKTCEKKRHFNQCCISKNFYGNNVFLGSNQYKRLNKLLKNKFFIESIKTQHKQFFNENEFILNQRCNTNPKRYSYANSKQTERNTSNSNEKIAIQMFDPRLKHKRRPSSGDPLKRYKMSSMLARLRKGSVCQRQKTINIQLGHIEPLKYEQKRQEQPIKQVYVAKTDYKSRQRLLKTQPTFRRSLLSKNQLRLSGQEINPWFDDQWKAKNICDEQINIKLLC